MAVLVTGGAGYIGSHMVRCLHTAKREVVVVDDLSAGPAAQIPAGVPLVVADVADQKTMRRVLDEYDVDAIVHFAARIQVGESVANPRRYWIGNLVATANLLECALDAGVRAFILSSTAAVYGTPDIDPIPESASLAPINPYGQTKLAIERMLESYGNAYGLRWAALRYFNAAGADADHNLGEHHEPESHLIPLVLDVALGRRPHITVFGDDYPTPDGTCIRDYVHVMDLADAHLAAIDFLIGGGPSGAMNLGSGFGYSVAEVVEVCRAVTKADIRIVVGDRRAGDPSSLVASPALAEGRLGWRAKRSSIARIVADAWAVRAHEHVQSTPPIGRKEQQVHAR